MKYLCVICLLFAQLAQAQAQAQAPLPALPSPENSKPTCQDRMDNDGDGHIDCDDQDCADFIFCARASTSDSMDMRVLRSKAATEITLGAILFSVGGAVLASSGAIWWAAGSNTDPTRGSAAAGALSVDVLGFAALIAGTVLIPIGVGHRVRATRITTEDR